MPWRKAVLMKKIDFIIIKFIFMTLQTCDFCMTESLEKKTQQNKLYLLSLSSFLPFSIQSVYTLNRT